MEACIAPDGIPAYIDAERSAIASALCRQEALADVYEVLGDCPEAFTDPVCR